MRSVSSQMTDYYGMSKVKGGHMDSHRGDRPWMLKHGGDETLLIKLLNKHDIELYVGIQYSNLPFVLLY